MGDGGILSTLGYKNMWPKLKDLRSDNSVKLLHFCCEKRVLSATMKLWVGQFCSMAMAAHAHDLIAEAFSWTDTLLHYKKTDLLIRKARELREALGDGPHNFDDKDTRKKIAEAANSYANMFPCSDSRQILMECFRLWVTQKGIGGIVSILVEKPLLPEVESNRERFYPQTLLPPVNVPESLVPREGDAIKEPASNPAQGPYHVLGTNHLRSEMDVEPDLVARCVMSAKGDVHNKSTIPCIYQQWTWCTRTKDEKNQRRWYASSRTYSGDPTTFREAPRFTTDSFPAPGFTLLNFRVFDYLRRRYSSAPPPGSSRFTQGRGGLAIHEYVRKNAVDDASDHGEGTAMDTRDMGGDVPMNDVQ